MKGKNFSGNNLGQRKASDFYETPYSITAQLLNTEKFNILKTVLEPAKGNGAITRVLDKFCFSKVTSYDVSDGTDFLKEKKKYDYIITNPPFSLAYEFILKAKEVARLKFAFLLPLAYLHGKSRFDNIYNIHDYCLKTVHVFTRYPMLGEKLRKDGKYNTGMMVYAWYVWDRLYIGKPEINWLDNDEYIIRKGK